MAIGKIKGYDKFIKDLKSLGKEGVKRISETTKANAQEIATNAKIAAKVGKTGKLQQSIKPLEIDNLNWKVSANATGNAPYAAYVEFGTGGMVKVPDELKEIAIQFKGKGVKEINLPARPFLYPAFVKGRIQYIKDLQDDLDDLTKSI
jgi:HK97 gp10 family phage protein